MMLIFAVGVNPLEWLFLLCNDRESSNYGYWWHQKHFDKDGKEYPRLFLCSTTHGAEAHGLAAALAVIQTYRDNDVIGHQHRMVARLDAGIRQAVIDAGMEKNIQVMNNTWVSISIFKDSEGVFNAALRTLFLQEMIARGVLYQGIFVPCYTHTEKDIDYIIRAYKESLVVYKKALDQGNTDGLLVGEACQPVFRKWN